jgi:hypothetical protein
MSEGKNIVAEAYIAEEFPLQFGIYDLAEFLGVMSLFDQPELDFSAKYVTLHEGKNAMKYFAADQSILKSVPTLKDFPEPDIVFDLSAAMLSQIQRVASILRVTDFSVVGDGSSIVASIGDKTNPTGNTFQSELGTTDKTFKLNYKVENLKMMPGDYQVSIGNKRNARFKATSQQLTYYVALELDSTFDF